mgnify:CR=1 FL=1
MPGKRKSEITGGDMLEFDMTEQQRIIRDSIRRIAQEHIKPRAAKADREYKPPLENLKVLAENG